MPSKPFLRYSLLTCGIAFAALRCDCGPTTGPLQIRESDFASALPYPICGMPRSCGECVARVFADDSECLETLGLWSNSWTDAARAAGLQYDQACVERIFQTWIGECPADPEQGWIACEDECQFYHGDAAAGEPCDIVGLRMSNCERGLACGVDGMCHPACELPSVAEFGQVCGVESGAIGVMCADGLACADGSCVQASSEGQPCGPDLPCGSSLWCEPESSLCAARLAPGVACSSHAACLFGVCDAGICVASQPSYCSRPPTF